MPTTPSDDGRIVIAVDPITALVDAGGGDDAQQSESSVSEVLQSETISADMVRKKLKKLDVIMFCVAALEWAGNAVGTLGFLWATVVMLGGFCSLLSRLDFWFSAIMVFIEGSRVFIRDDASVNQWLFGSTSAFRWENFSGDRMFGMSDKEKVFAMMVGVNISLTPVETRPEMVAGILKVVVLVISLSLLIFMKRWMGSKWSDACTVYCLSVLGLSSIGGAAGVLKLGLHYTKRSKANRVVSVLKVIGILAAWLGATGLLALLAILIMAFMAFVPSMRKTVPLLCLDIIIASGLSCLPFLQAVFGSFYRFFSTSVTLALLVLSSENLRGEEDDSSLSRSHSGQYNSPCGLLLKVLDKTILPILFLWSVVFPVLGISLKISFYMLFSVIAALLLANLQIPVAFLQILLSIMRLRSLLGHHNHDYRPLPKDASPNLVPSIVVFFMLELCQGSSYILATILGLISLFRRRSLARDLGFKRVRQFWGGFENEWAENAVDLYCHKAYEARKEKGLFPSNNSMPSLTSLAIESLDSTSTEMQIAGLHVLDNFLERFDHTSKEVLIAEITYAVPTLIDMLGSSSTSKDIRLLAAKIIEKLSDRLKISEFPSMVKLIPSLLERQPYALVGLSILQKLVCNPDNCAEIAKDATNIITKIRGFISYVEDEENSYGHQRVIGVYYSAFKFLRRLAIIGGKTGARFRQQLLENPFLLNRLKRMLDCEPVMDIVAKLALDEAARQEIGGTHSIMRKLMDSFLRSDNNDRSLQLAAGEALGNLTIMSTDNCLAILFAGKDHNLIEKLINMLKDEYYICVAANLLHNLCANSRDKLIDLDAKVHLESALPKVMELIRTKEGEQLEAALCIASQIGYVIPEYFAQVLEPDIDAASAEKLVEKLVVTLKSNMEPCLKYPRIRRVLVEVVISTVVLCPGYIKIFRAKGAKDALDMVKGTPSRLEKYRVFLDGEGVVAESLPMRDLVDKAKRLIDQPTSTPGCGASEFKCPMDQR